MANVEEDYDDDYLDEEQLAWFEHMYMLDQGFKHVAGHQAEEVIPFEDWLRAYLDQIKKADEDIENEKTKTNVCK